jgi:hypothetical protein
MPAPSGPLNEIDLHVEVRGDLLIVQQLPRIFTPSTPSLINAANPQVALRLAVTSFSDARGKLQTRRRAK